MRSFRGNGFLVMLLMAIAGCAHREEQGPQILPPPKPETVTVDLATELEQLAARTAPVMRPSGSKPSAARLASLKPLLLPETPVLFTLSDSVKYDGDFPGAKGDWSAWDQGVEKLVREKASSKPLYQIWSEPDKKESFNGSQADFFSIWVHTAKLIRRLDPKAVLMGPSVATHGWVQEFMKIAKEHDVLPDIVAFHETPKPDMPGHIASTSEQFWQDGTNRSVIYVSQTKSGEHKYLPSDVVLMLAQLQKAHQENLARAIDERYCFKLTHLGGKEPRAILGVYQIYAAMVGQTQLKTSAGSTLDGVATRDPKDGAVTLLLGRNHARRSTTQPALGEATLLIKGIKGPGIAVTAWRIRKDPPPSTQPATRPATQATTHASTAPATKPTLEQTAHLRVVVPAKNGEARIPLTGFGSGDAMVLSIRTIDAPDYPKLLKETP